jgi:hypothetical protein
MVMNITTALEAHKMIEEIKLNNADTDMFKRAMENGIDGVQLVIQGKDGSYHSAIYREDRIELLLRVLQEENIRLMNKLEEL